MPRGYLRLARMLVCLGVALGLMNELPQSAALSGESESNNELPIVSMSPEDGATYPAGSTIPFSVTAWDADGTIEEVVFYVDDTWYATRYSAPYEVLLPDAAPGVYTLTAIAWDDSWESTTTSHTLIVGPSDGGSNQSPAIVISSPESGTNYPARSSIPFAATAWDSDGTIAAVEFYVDSVLYATQYYGPYGIWLPDAAPGTYTLTAVAWDNDGASGSDIRTLTVEGSPLPLPPPTSNQPPIVSLTDPGFGAAFTAPATITLSAAASDVDGTIAQVEFYANGTWLRTVTSSPYSFLWTGVSAGDYALLAVAADNDGATTVSSTIDISVGSGNVPSTAVFGPSYNHATAVNYYVLDVFPLGADPTVANPVASVYLGKPAIANGECRVDVSTTILALAPGTYIATVTAVGDGGTAQSAPSAAFTR